MDTQELIRCLWIVNQHANDTKSECPHCGGTIKDYVSIIDRRKNIKVMKEACRLLRKYSKED